MLTKCNTFVSHYKCSNIFFIFKSWLNETVARSPKGQVLLVLWWGFAECGNRKALRLRAQGVYSCKWRGLNVDNNAASTVLCNGLLIIVWHSVNGSKTIKRLWQILAIAFLLILIPQRQLLKSLKTHLIPPLHTLH